MNPKPILVLLAAALLGSCAESADPERVAGGGFETSDLQVVAVDTASNLLAGARIWMLDDQSDSTVVPSPLDSVRSDSLGRGRLRLQGSGRGRIGIEAWSGDSLVGILRRVDVLAGVPLRIVLRRARLLRVPCSTLVQGRPLFLQGSHLPILPPATCVDSFEVRVPPGAWNLIALGGGGGPWVYPFQGDTLPLVGPKGPGPMASAPMQWGAAPAEDTVPPPLPR